MASKPLVDIARTNAEAAITKDARHQAAAPLMTPDGRYIVVRGRLWRRTNPHLPEDERARLVSELMIARREIKSAEAAGDDDRLASARVHVQAAKVALGERGPVWGDDGSPDLNRKLARNTPYAEWYASAGPDVS